MILKLLCIAFIVAAFSEASPLECPFLGCTDRAANTKANLALIALPRSEDEIIAEKNSELIGTLDSKNDIAIVAHETSVFDTTPKPKANVDGITPKIPSIAIPYPEDYSIALGYNVENRPYLLPRDNHATSTRKLATRRRRQDYLPPSGSLAIPEPEDSVRSADVQSVSLAIPKPEDELAVMAEELSAPLTIPKSENSVVSANGNLAPLAIPEPEDDLRLIAEEFSAPLAAAKSDKNVLKADGNLPSLAIPEPEDDLTLIADEFSARLADAKSEKSVVKTDENLASLAIPEPEDDLTLIAEEFSARLADAKSEKSVVKTDENLASLAIPEPEDDLTLIAEEFSAPLAVSKSEKNVVKANGNLPSLAIPEPEDGLAVISESNLAIVANENPKTDAKLTTAEHWISWAIPRPEDDAVVEPSKEDVSENGIHEPNEDIDVPRYETETVPEIKPIATVLGDEGTLGNHGEFSIIYGPTASSVCPPSVPKCPQSADDKEDKPDNEIIEVVPENTQDLPAEETTTASSAVTEAQTTKPAEELEGIFKVASKLFHRVTNEGAGTLTKGVDDILLAKQKTVHAMMNLVDAKAKLVTSLQRPGRNIVDELMNS